MFMLYTTRHVSNRAYIFQSIPSHKSDCKKVDLVIDIRPGDENISVLIDDTWARLIAITMSVVG